MNVKELINKLQKFPQDATVYINTESISDNEKDKDIINTELMYESEEMKEVVIYSAEAKNN